MSGKQVSILTVVTIIISTGIIAGIGIILPFVLDFMYGEDSAHLLIITGNILIYLTIFINIIDIIFLIKKQNKLLFTFVSMSLTISLFLLLEFAFLTDKFGIIYVANYSDFAMPAVYKIVAIWAGQSGSLLSWMFFNSIIIAFYRIYNTDKEDTLFLLSVLISTIVSVIFLFIFISLKPFVFNPSMSPLWHFEWGYGLDPDLLSPFMIWHPFFVFVSYAIYLIPFIIEIGKLFRPGLELKGEFQKKYSNFTLRVGWLILTIGIGLGSYWAKVTANWGDRFWAWDPVETASLIPWFFATAIFHPVMFRKKPKIKIVNMISIFLSIVFATLITRGGGFNSSHAYAGKLEMIIFATISGIIPLMFSLWIIYELIDKITEDYKNLRRTVDYLSYFFLYALAFICIFGLIVPLVTELLSYITNMETININDGYYMTTCLYVALGLAISLIFCSLIGIFKPKRIILFIVAGVVIHFVISILIFIIIKTWINPLVGIFYAALASTIINLVKHFNIKKGLSAYFKKNARVIIHLGLSLVLIGTMVGENMLRAFYFFTGFSVLIIGISPAIIVSFYVSKDGKLQTVQDRVQEGN